jgi:hypothetical protein
MAQRTGTPQSARRTMRTEVPLAVEKRVITPEEYFAALNEPAQTLAREVRALVMANQSDINEEMKWGIPCYSRLGILCYLNAAPKGVVLGFMRGREMSDAFDLFNDKPLKLVRHIDLPNLDFIRTNADNIMDYISEAVVLNDVHHKR